MFLKKDHNQSGGGCPGSAMRQWSNADAASAPDVKEPHNVGSQLRQWPVQLMLVPPNAPYFNNADLLIVADCVPFAHGDFHNEFLKERPIVVGCPKLDNLQFYVDKLTEIFRVNKINSVEVLLMEVPCCGGIGQAAQIARQQAEANFPVKLTTIGVRGENFGTREV